MKKIWTEGSPRNKITAFVVAFLLAFVIMLPQSVSAAIVEYTITGVHKESGMITFEGYFSNSANYGVRVTGLHMKGNADGINWGGDWKLNISIGAGGTANYRCSISDSKFRSSNNPVNITAKSIDVLR